MGFKNFYKPLKYIPYMVSLAVDENTFKRILTIILIAVLIILAFLILRPILISTIFGLILALVFHPLYKWFLSKFRNSNLSAIIMTLILILIVLIPLLFLIPVIVRQTFDVYTYMQKTDLVTPLNNIFSKFFTSSPELAKNLAISLNSFTSKIASSFLNNFQEILLNSPSILLHLFLILFVFFFGLRDGEIFVKYLQDVSPLSKESGEKIFKQFKDITNSVVFGQIVTGIVQGILAGAILFILQIPNAAILTILAIFFAILPIIGPWIVWVPVDVYLFLTNQTVPAFILLFYGLIVISWVDNLLRPYIVGKRTKINSGVILVSMIGGLLVFGILGLIIGPLVISYLILLLEFYRNKKTPSLMLQQPTQQKV